MNATEGALWYALYVRIRFEKIVARNLRGKGYEEFLPLYRPSRHSRIGEIDRPLFPGYVFCRFNIFESLPIVTTPGVTAIVGLGKSFSPVDECELNALRAALKSGNPCDPWPFLKVGERVRVEYGPLAGTEGIVVMFKDTCRLVISVSVLERSVAVDIDRDCLRPVITKSMSEKEPEEHPSVVLSHAPRRSFGGRVRR